MSPDPLAPQVLVVFGASEDLTGPKMLPLSTTSRAPGCANASPSSATPRRRRDGFRARARQAVERFSRRRVDYASWERFAEALFCVSGRFDDPGCFPSLFDRLARIDSEQRAEGRRLYYCATPPEALATIARRLGGMDPSPTP